MNFKGCLCVGLMLVSGVVWANEPEIKRLGVSSDWVAYQVDENGSKVCYIAARPIKSEGKYKKRGDVFLTVMHRPADNVYDEVSFAAGYPYNVTEKPTIAVDKNPAVSFFSRGENAWFKEKTTDEKLIAQMRKGNKAVVKGRSTRRTRTTDTISLKGFSKAYQMINEACHWK